MTATTRTASTSIWFLIGKIDTNKYLYIKWQTGSTLLLVAKKSKCQLCTLCSAPNSGQAVYGGQSCEHSGTSNSLIAKVKRDRCFKEQSKFSKSPSLWTEKRLWWTQNLWVFVFVTESWLKGGNNISPLHNIIQGLDIMFISSFKWSFPTDDHFPFEKTAM